MIAALRWSERPLSVEGRDVCLWRYHGSNTVRCDVGFRGSQSLPRPTLGAKLPFGADTSMPLLG